MRLNLAILEEELRQKFTCVERGAVRDYRLHVSGAALLARTELDSRLVYVAEARRLPVQWKHRGPASVIVAGRPEPGYFENSQTEYLCVEEKRFALVFNAVSEIFRKYQDFDETLKGLLLEGAAPEQCCDCVSRFLVVPLLVFDSSLRLLYCSEEAKELLDWEQDLYSGRRLLPTEFVNQLELVHPCSGEQEGGAVLLEDDRLPYHVLTTFFERRAYTVLAFETEKRLTPPDGSPYGGHQSLCGKGVCPGYEGADRVQGAGCSDCFHAGGREASRGGAEKQAESCGVEDRG